MSKNKRSKDKMSKLIKANIPMWEIEGNDKINDYAEEIAEVSLQLKSIEAEIKEINENIEGIDSRINIYLSNVLNIPDFKQSKHAVLIRDDYNIEIYDAKDIETSELDIEDYGNITGAVDLPEPLMTCKSGKKQTLKILNYLNEYNSLVDDFNSSIDEYTDYSESHEELWTEVKEIVKTLKYFKLHDNDEEVESFDINKHILLIALNDSEEWGFKYIRKEDEKEFNKLLKEESSEN